MLPGADEETLAVGARSLKVRRTPGGGYVACCAADRSVSILIAPSRMMLASMIERQLPTAAPAETFTPRTQVPMYLDRFDRYGLMVYYGPWKNPPKQEHYDYNVDFRFARDNRFGLILWQTPSLFHTSHPARAVPSGPKVSHAHARSYMRCRPIQTVCGPGSLLGRST
ncbi:MAG: hypothetical protein ABSH20_01515, partial [Tepidisphaeraceae bacterium]